MRGCRLPSRVSGAVGGAFAGALMPSGTDQALHILGVTDAAFGHGSPQAMRSCTTDGDADIAGDSTSVDSGGGRLMC